MNPAPPVMSTRMAGGYGSPDHHLRAGMWWDAPVLLVAVAVGALTAAVLAVVRPQAAAALPPALVWVASAAGAVVLAVSDAALTGWEPFDLVVRAGFGAVVPLAAARGTVATVWLMVVATATLLVADAPLEAVTAVAAGAFLALVAAASASPPAASIAAAAAIGPLAHADWPLASGASAAAMALATIPVLAVGLARTRKPLRTRILVAGAAGVVVLGIGAVVGLASALSARSDVDAAVDLATRGIDLLGDDDDAARTTLLDAAGAFESAEDTLRAWWARPALLVPGVAQQARAVSTMASAGGDLARTAAEATAEADVDSVRPREGRVDLDALAALAGPLDRSLASLQRADARLDDVDSPLLLEIVSERLERLRSEVRDALGSAELASQAVELAPQMLGSDEPRRYFIAFQNPAEITGNGGFLGNWAELIADDGELILSRSGRNKELTEGGSDPEGRRIEGEDEYVDVYGQSAAQYWGNINFTPDHPTASRIMAQLYPQSGGAPVDGVIAVTPQGLASFLELTGPITVDGYPEQLGADNISRIMLHEQYLAYPQEDAEDREAFLSEAVEVLFDALTSGTLPGPRVLAKELGAAAEARHLQLWAQRPEEQALFEQMGAAGSVERSNVDSFGVVTQNFNGSKIDWFLHRELAYDIEWDPPSGSVEGTLSVRIENRAPSSGLPASIIGWGGDVSLGQRPVADGENFMMVTLYASVPIDRITVDGEPVDYTPDEELGHQTGRFYLSVPSESVREVVAELRGVVEPSSRYIARALRQPTINPDVIDVAISLSDGWRIDAVRGGQSADGGTTALTRENATTEVRLAIDAARRASTLNVLDRLRGAP